MRTLNVRFSDAEYKELRKARIQSDASSWEKWMMEQAKNINTRQETKK